MRDTQRQTTDALAQWHADAAAYRDLLEMMLRFLTADRGRARAGDGGRLPD